MEVKVDCYAGYRGEETPRRLAFEKHIVEVIEVIDRWLSPDYRYFKVRGDDKAIYIIRHDTQKWIWELTYYRSEDCDSHDFT